MYINIYFLDYSHFPILIYQSASDFSLFNKRILYKWKILYKWSQEEMEIKGNFNCRREMYPQDEGHLRMTQSLGSKSTKKKVDYLTQGSPISANRVGGSGSLYRWPWVCITPRRLLNSFLLELSTKMSVGRRELTRMSNQPVTPALSAQLAADRTMKEGRKSISPSSLSPTSIIHPSTHSIL